MTQQTTEAIKREGAWLEAISMFEAVRRGERQTASRLLQTTVDSDRVTSNLLSLLGVLVRGMETADLDRFIESARRAGPPPPIENRPDQAFALVRPSVDGCPRDGTQR